ncbi:MAG: type III-B CRISPR module RAMP protein Cmr1 [Desulfobacca sp.]|uniref:type III-B CRISPR module RAMP protein Cmr1 n=1 Tax=Desulfobacca sp. TaxID=2067990 RepID=UPI004049B48F
MSCSFEVRFITPLLMGGSDPRELDSLGLRGNSLRGVWRFWLRALLGGMLPTSRPDTLLALENEVFGKTGRATFRLRLLRQSANRQDFLRLPHKTGGAAAQKPGYQEGARFQVDILPRPHVMSADMAKVLLAGIWLWGYLGAMGNRARRGFGSPVLAPAAGQTNPFETLDLQLRQEFQDADDLAQYLRAGICACWQAVAAWLAGQGLTPLSITSLTAAATSLGSFPFFTLANLHQVAVSTRNFADLGCLASAPSKTGAIATIHGDRSASPELGRVHGGRLASPVFLRLHKVGNNWVPVCTWSKFNGILDRGLALAYLRRLGFSASLVGVAW